MEIGMTEIPTTAARRGHGLPCPVCSLDLVMSDRQGIEIDYCPKCRGVWLDRGELDKIVERSAALTLAAVGAQQPAVALGQPAVGQPAQYSSHHGSHSGHRKKSWLQDLFD